MKVLVTGAGGFLGAHIVAALRARGQDVRGLDIAYPAPLPDGAEAVTGSILDPAAVRDAVSGVDAVIHAAAIAHLWSPGRFDHDRVNVVGTCRILAEARRADIRLVHVSSFTTLVGRDTPTDAVLDESVEIPPSRLLGSYPRTKRQAELFVLSAAAAGLSACMVLPAAPVGAGDRNMTAPTQMLRDLAAGAIPALLKSRLNLVDARAVANATVAAIERGEPGARYLLSGEDIELTDLARRVAQMTGTPAPRRTVPLSVALAAARVEAGIARLTGRPPVAPLTGVRLAARPCFFDSSKARRELGFAPRPLDDCLREALGWLHEREPARVPPLQG